VPATKSGAKGVLHWHCATSVMTCAIYWDRMHSSRDGEMHGEGEKNVGEDPCI
jgi:hypothetical protein